MGDAPGQIIRIAAAVIDDDRGRLLLVRKAGTASFMQAGGKIEAGEGAWNAQPKPPDPANRKSGS